MNLFFKIIFLVIIFCSTATLAQYHIRRSIFDGGFVGGANTEYRFRGSIGQPCVGVAADVVKICYSGFWYNYQTSVGTRPHSNLLDLEYRLEQNYPNPFNPTTTIEYTLPRSGHVRLTTYDSLGRCVSNVVNAKQQPGFYRTEWKGTDEHNRPVAAGMYFCRLQAGGFVRVIKLALIR